MWTMRIVSDVGCEREDNGKVYDDDDGKIVNEENCRENY